MLSNFNLITEPSEMATGEFAWPANPGCEVRPDYGAISTENRKDLNK